MKQRTLMMGAALALALTAQAAWACGGCGCTPKKADAKKADVKKATCSTCTADASKAHAHAHTIDTAALKKDIEGKKVIVLDARAGKFDDGRRIPSAKQLAPTADAKTLASVAGSDKSAKIVTYCSSTKCGASAKLAKRLKKEGYTNVIEYPVGIAGWVEGGNKVEKK